MIEVLTSRPGRSCCSHRYRRPDQCQVIHHVGNVGLRGLPCFPTVINMVWQLASAVSSVRICDSPCCHSALDLLQPVTTAPALQQSPASEPCWTWHRLDYLINFMVLSAACAGMYCLLQYSEQAGVFHAHHVWQDASMSTACFLLGWSVLSCTAQSLLAEFQC